MTSTGVRTPSDVFSCHDTPVDSWAALPPGPDGAPTGVTARIAGRPCATPPADAAGAPAAPALSAAGRPTTAPAEPAQAPPVRSASDRPAVDLHAVEPPVPAHTELLLDGLATGTQVRVAGHVRAVSAGPSQRVVVDLTHDLAAADAQVDLLAAPGPGTDDRRARRVGVPFTAWLRTWGLGRWHDLVVRPGGTAGPAGGPTAPDRVHVRVEARLEPGAGACTAFVSVCEPGGVALAAAGVALDSGGVAEHTLEVPGAARWVPAAHGARPAGGHAQLYDVVLRLVDARGRVLDERRRRVGLRGTAPGSDPARPVVDGTPVWVRGLEWHVEGPYLGPVPEADVPGALARAASVGVGLLHVSGGTAPRAFYDTCDRLGLLVSQHLPAHGPEAADVLRHLRHRACIVLWHGASPETAALAADLDGTRPVTADLPWPRVDATTPDAPRVHDAVVAARADRAAGGLVVAAPRSFWAGTGAAPVHAVRDVLRARTVLLHRDGDRPVVTVVNDTPVPWQVDVALALRGADGHEQLSVTVPRTVPAHDAVRLDPAVPGTAVPGTASAGAPPTGAPAASTPVGTGTLVAEVHGVDLPAAALPAASGPDEIDLELVAGLAAAPVGVQHDLARATGTVRAELVPVTADHLA